MKSVGSDASRLLAFHPSSFPCWNKAGIQISLSPFLDNPVAEQFLHTRNVFPRKSIIVSFLTENTRLYYWYIDIYNQWHFSEKAERSIMEVSLKTIEVSLKIVEIREKTVKTLRKDSLNFYKKPV